MTEVAGNPTLRVAKTIFSKFKSNMFLFLSGQVLTHWSTSTSGSRPSVLQGGMTYSNGYITVPESGIYFIYFNLYTGVSSSSGNQHPAIFVDSVRIGFSIHYYENTYVKSHYLGKLWNVRKGSQLSVRAGGGNGRHAFYSDHSCFGAWKVN